MRWVFTGSFLLFFFAIAMGQLPSRNYFITSANIGVNWATYTERGPAELSQIPGAAFQLGIGQGRYLNDRWHIEAEGLAFLDIYNFQYTATTDDRVDMTISNFNLRCQAGIGYIAPFKNNYFSQLRLGLHGGFSFFQPDVAEFDLFSSEGQSFAVGQSITNPFLAGKIGLRKQFRKNTADIGITYNYHFEDSPSVTFNFFTPDGTSLAESKGDYLGLYLRFNVGYNENVVEKSEVLPFERTALGSRDTVVQAPLVFNQRRVKIIIHDKAEEDGDVLSVQLNGEWILKDIEVKKEKQTFIIHLDAGDNTLLFFAENEGRISPNTANIQLISGLKRYSVRTKTSDTRNESIQLVMN
ncbi:MAG: hypothetical protein HRT74_01155 [Flavobacteriales bacterium]|nr:hypothetical protein [Flavobacteriales bacterium]